ncbi:hypothetical protein [Thermococcus thermotolerans]|uniref:hypothetical protein n=1 Tax=Thermococcus thermotolerans TaxID=2969672 RepID=UPI00215861DD|nr:hypothetical protein [Thermococcus thermotolerans]
MGVDNYLYFVFGEKPEEVENFLKKEFEIKIRDEEFDDPRMEHFKRKGTIDESFGIIAAGDLFFDPLRNIRGESVANADFWIYTVKDHTILEIHPNPRSKWWDVYSHELMKFLTVFMNEGTC